MNTLIGFGLGAVTVLSIMGVIVVVKSIIKTKKNSNDIKSIYDHFKHLDNETSKVTDSIFSEIKIVENNLHDRIDGVLKDLSDTIDENKNNIYRDMDTIYTNIRELEQRLKSRIDSTFDKLDSKINK